MPRPVKYATAKEAAENNLYSKMGGPDTGLSLEEFIGIVTSKCEICGCKPDQSLVVKRAQDKYDLHYNYMSGDYESKPGRFRYKTVCKMCRILDKEYGIKIILRHAARIMAKRMHDKK